MKKVLFFAIMIAFSALTNAQSGIDLTNHFKKVDFKKGDTLIVGDSGFIQKRTIGKTIYPKTQKVQPVRKTQQGSGWVPENTAGVVNNPPVVKNTTPEPPNGASVVMYQNLEKALGVANNWIWILELLIVCLVICLLVLLLAKKVPSAPSTITQHFHNYGGSGGEGGNLTVDSYNERTTRATSDFNFFQAKREEKKPQEQTTQEKSQEENAEKRD